MKKFTLLAALVFGIFSTYNSVQAQGLEIGIKVSPAITGQRIIAPSGHGIVKEGAKARIGVGIVADYFFGENYAFSTGLEFATKGAGASYQVVGRDPFGAKYLAVDANGNKVKNEDEFTVQYLQIPVGLKLFTNEVATDMRVYFQVGTSLNFRIASKVNDEKFFADYSSDNIKTNKRFNFFEADAVLGSGVELQLGSSTKVFGGLSYHHGLTDMDNYFEDYYEGLLANPKDIAVKNYTLALDLGIKF